MIYLNTLSMISLESILLNQNSLKQSLAFLNSIEQKFLLCVPCNTPEFLVEENITFKQALSSISDSELRTLLITILANSTCYLGEYPKSHFHQPSNDFFNAFETYLGTEPPEKIILSVHSNVQWENNFVSLINNAIESSFPNCPSLNFNNFIDGINKWEGIIKIFISKNEKIDSYLCHGISVKKLIPKILYDKYLSEIQNPNLKIQNIRAMAKLVAECCEYQYSHEISQRNRLGPVIRDIYYNQTNELYISTDIIHGRFEVLNSAGIHICEVDFEGKQTKSRDVTGLHNIII